VDALNLDDFADLVERPDPAFQREAEERRQRLAIPAGSLGRLEELGDWLAGTQGQCPTRPLENVKAVLFAADHGVARLGVSAREPGTAAELVRAVLEGSAPVSVLARVQGVPVRVVDMAVDCDPEEFPAEVTRHRVRRGSGRIDVENALTREEAERAFRAGMAIADEEADSGTDLVVLGDVSVGGTTVAGVLIAALCGTDASVVTGRGSGIDDLTWMRKCAAIRDSLRRARPVLGDALELLAAVGGADVAAMSGFLAQSTVRRTPVLLDGVVSAACALVVQRIAFRAPDWWQAGHASGEPGQAKALDRLTLEPLLDYGVKVGEGAGALLALPLLRSAASLLAELPEVVPAEAEAKPDEAVAAEEAGETDGDAAAGPAPTGEEPAAQEPEAPAVEAPAREEPGTPADAAEKPASGGEDAAAGARPDAGRAPGDTSPE
jgi:nicotinate-nucleotide--dimethylbenzimidazole phosphoribosyltransferase